jgi:outer membrane protein, multidrug efflux system
MLSRWSTVRAGARPLVLVLAACQVGPDYERPTYPMPTSFRGGVDPGLVDPGRLTLGDLEWSWAFTDPVLHELVYRAVANSYDVRAAAERVLEARAQVTRARADRSPDIQAGVSVDSGAEAGLNLGLGWELDFWGRISRATEAARAEVLASEFARGAVIQTLVADLALAYFELLSLDAELGIARGIHRTRVRSYELVVSRLEHGVVSHLELRQAEGAMFRAAAVLPELEGLVEQQENLIQLLVGGNPGPVPRAGSVLGLQHVVEIPSGLPSRLIERRPDVRAAEQVLVAANARIGAARALLFPTFRLTADGDLNSFGLVASITQAIFRGGRLRAGQRVAESREHVAVLLYLQTLQVALAEVADALVAHRKSAEVRVWTERQETALKGQTGVALEQYYGDVTGYLEVLASQREHYGAQLERVHAVRDELFAYVQLYRALGGGWRNVALEGAG